MFRIHIVKKKKKEKKDKQIYSQHVPTVQNVHSSLTRFHTNFAHDTSRIRKETCISPLHRFFEASKRVKKFLLNFSIIRETIFWPNLESKRVEPRGRISRGESSVEPRRKLSSRGMSWKRVCGESSRWTRSPRFDSFHVKGEGGWTRPTQLYIYTYTSFVKFCEISGSRFRFESRR